MCGDTAQSALTPTTTKLGSGLVGARDYPKIPAWVLLPLWGHEGLTIKPVWAVPAGILGTGVTLVLFSSPTELKKPSQD